MRRLPCLIFTLTSLSLAQSPPVVTLLSDLIKIDTSNPPGNERRIADYLAPIFAKAGFEVDIVRTPQAEKAHFIARLRGDGSKRPVLIAAHADVVGVEREKWTVDPFAGVVKDGYIYGRGAIDFKGGLAVFVQAALDIAYRKTKLKRDLIVLVESDEEGGLYNTGYLAEKAFAKIDCEFALNEGGWIIRDAAGKVQYVSISTADKSSVSLLLRAKGTSTHSSMPLADNAIYRLARALTKLSAYDTKPKLNDSTKQFFSTLAEVSEEPMKTHFRNLVASADPEKVKAADQAISAGDPLLHAIMRNTIAPVLMNAGFRGNVIPGSAEVTINFRTLPGTTAGELIDEMATVINDPLVEITQSRVTSMAGTKMTEEQKEAMEKRAAAMSRPVEESPRNTELYAALERQAKATYPGALVTPYLFQAGTDARPWRERGIPVYGIYPYPITLEDLRRMHGNDERVPIDSLVSGVKLITNTLLEVAK